MTISSATRKAGPYLGDGVAVALPFSFKVFAASDLRVVRTSAGGVETDLALGSGYSVSLNADQDATPGGTVILAVPAATGERTTIGSSIDPLQLVDLPNQGGFYPRVLSDALDRLTIIAQQLQEEQGRALRVPFSDVSGGFTMEDASNRASKLLGFDSSGRPAYIALTSGSATAVALQLASLIADLADVVTAGKGASLVGVRDVGGYFASTQVEGALQELAAAAAAVAVTVAGHTGSLATALPNVTAATAMLAALRGGRTAPHANFAWFTSDFTVAGCRGPGQAVVQQDLRDVWRTKYGALMTGGISCVSASAGNDSTGSGTYASPWATIDKALRSSASGEIHVMPGTYDSTGFRYTDTQGDRPKMLVAPFGGVTIRTPGDTISSATWTANGTYPNVWETTLSTTNWVTRVLHAGRLDRFGLPTPLPRRASLAELDGAGIGWYYDAATRKLAVRHHAESVNTVTKASLSAVYATSGDNQLLIYSTKLYIEGITLLQYPYVLHAAGQATPECWLRNCTVRYAESHSRTVQGGGCYSQGGTYYRSTADHANYNSADGITAYGVEIGDTTAFAGDPDTYGSGATQPNNPISTGQNKNGSSNHDGFVVRINGSHSDSYGPCIADTAGSYSWGLGVTTGTSYATGASWFGWLTQGSTARAWLDACACGGGSGGINADSSAVVNIWATAGAQSSTSGGTFAAYTPS